MAPRFGREVHWRLFMDGAGGASVALARAVTAESLQRAAESWERSRDESDRYTLLREHKQKRVFRFATGQVDTPSIIVKTWAVDRGSILSRLKRAWLGASRACEKEFRMGRRLEVSAPLLKVPHAIARHHRMEVLGERCEVLLTEDLGPVETLMAYIGKHAHDVTIQRVVEDFVVNSAVVMLLDARVIDDDHSLLNMVHSPLTGKVHRIDFEVALPWRSSVYPARAVGGMLARMITTYAYAHQPNVVPVELMVRRLVRELSGKLPRSAWSIAYGLTTKALERQRLSQGIDTRPDLSVLAEAGRSR